MVRSRADFDAARLYDARAYGLKDALELFWRMAELGLSRLPCAALHRIFPSNMFVLLESPASGG